MTASVPASPGLPDRTLASSPSSIQSPSAADSPNIEVLRLDCLFDTGAAPAIRTQAKMVRISAGLCGNRKMPVRPSNLSGKNQTSGEDIVPFLQGDEAISTNYFSLTEGRNLIAIRLDLGKGKELRQELVLERTIKSP